MRSGRRPINSKLWYMSKIPYDYTVIKTAAHDIQSTLLTLSGEAKKLFSLILIISFGAVRSGNSAGKIQTWRT